MAKGLLRKYLSLSRATPGTFGYMRQRCDLGEAWICKIPTERYCNNVARTSQKYYDAIIVIYDAEPPARQLSYVKRQRM
jgi:hypothetical protein